MYEYRALVLSVHDGDSLIARVDVGFRVSIDMPIRLNGIDTPELNAKDAAVRAAAMAARDYLKGLIEGKDVRVFTQKDRTEKYGRYLGTIYLDWAPVTGNKSVNQMMIDGGYAVPYSGGPRT